MMYAITVHKAANYSYTSTLLYSTREEVDLAVHQAAEYEGTIRVDVHDITLPAPARSFAVTQTRRLVETIIPTIEPIAATSTQEQPGAAPKAPAAQDNQKGGECV